MFHKTSKIPNAVNNKISETVQYFRTYSITRHNVIPFPPTFCRGRKVTKKFPMLAKKGGAWTFWIFRGKVSKRGSGFFSGTWGYSGSGFQLLIKYRIRLKNVNYSYNHNHNVLYLLTSFKCFQHVNQTHFRNIKR